MFASDVPFVFIENADDVEDFASPQDFRLQVPKGIAIEMDIFLHYMKEGDFPDYFGRNWDALLDCLSDFSWANQYRILIIHNDLPLIDHEKDLRIYLEILKTAVDTWNEVREGPFIEPIEGWVHIEHKLIVVFPVNVKEKIIQILKQTR